MDTLLDLSPFSGCLAGVVSLARLPFLDVSFRGVLVYCRLGLCSDVPLETLFLRDLSPAVLVSVAPDTGVAGDPSTFNKKEVKKNRSP